MKKLFLMLAAAAAVASCSKDYTIVADQGEAIEFGNAFVDNSTRATDPTYGDPTYGAQPLTKFNVYGTVAGTIDDGGTVNIFDGDIVEGSVGNNVWSCDVKQYWIKDAIYKFAAVVDVDEDEDDLPDGVAVDTNGMPETITYNTENQNDLLYATATATGLATGNSKVNFSFSHLLAKAQFTVKSNTADGYFHNVKNIKVKNFANGVYTVGEATPWSTTTATPDTLISFGNIEGVEATDTNGVTNATQMLLLPTTAEFVVSFTVEIWNGTTLLGTQDYTKNVSQDLEAGHAYDFNINLSVGELIQFTVTSNPTWADETDVTL